MCVCVCVRTCVYMYALTVVQIKTPKMNNDLESSVKVGQLQWANTLENSVYIYMRILPFWAYRFHEICSWDPVQVFGRHRPNYDCDSQRANPLRESPVKTCVVLVLEVLHMLQSLNDSITSLRWSSWIFSGLLRRIFYFLDLSGSKSNAVLSPMVFLSSGIRHKKGLCWLKSGGLWKPA